ncbi:MAG: PD40 domain-containing protein [Planctomycetes bacterium]|nr:PD40 domain-containing protein [Planctomycetota bacterium]
MCDRNDSLMKGLGVVIFLFVCLLAGMVQGAAYEEIRLGSEPALSPDGSMLAFVWRGDIWFVPSEGGVARQLTQHPSDDEQPAFSPDGSEIAFISDRDAGDQVYVVPIEGGTPRQLTFHTAGYSLEEWYPSGDGLLVIASRDHFWRGAQRFFKISRHERKAADLLFDAYGQDGVISPDGKRLLFTREGMTWWRKGYYGARASQIWMYDFETGEYTKLLHRETSSRSPLWKAEGSGFYYVGAQSGAFNLWEYDLETGEERQLTEFEDDSVVLPCISRDGSTIVFRHLFDFYRFRPGEDTSPTRIDIKNTGDTVTPPLERRVVEKATDVAFSQDGLEISFIAGGNLWVMDTELREPRQVTDTPEQERTPVFSPDGEYIFFASDKAGQCDIWRAKRADAELYWWQNEKFELKRLTQDGEVESDIRFSPDGSRLSFVKGLGDLWTITPEGKDAKRLLRSWNPPQYDWSPDSKWIVYSIDDDNFNRDIWIMPVDGSCEPVNISRHPYDEHSPVWRPDGKVIAFTGQRLDREMDIFYVWLEKQEYEKGKRDRTIEKALKKMDDVRKKKDEKKGKEEESKDDEADAESKEVQECKESEQSKEEEESTGKEQETNDEKKDKKNEVPEVVIDFERIHERVRRVEIAGSTERGLFWSHDSKKLAFTATIDGKKGTYTIEIPEELKPKLLTEKTGGRPRWLKEGNQIVWLSGGKPASVSSKGEETVYSFSTKQEVEREAHFRAAFDLAWRLMRDRYYDERLGNRNWDTIRRKYSEMAAKAVDAESFGIVVNLMLGELNGSHLGFSPRRRSPGPAQPAWDITTAHLGVRFEPNYKGPGLKVKDVLPNGPADREKSRVKPGEIIRSIDGINVDPGMDLTEVLNGPLDRDIHLSVQSADDERREVVLRPISYGAVRTLLYEKWIRDNRKKVQEASDRTLGYVHIRGMNWPSFQKLERELYAEGAGKEGLVIDVRNNGGGFTTDHLLTILCQPVHAITVPRGGGPGYPEDRRVYATWSKPIIVLCNQNSFSNAEIFSHAIKTLKRGKLVGVPTAGGVISTGSAQVMDVGRLRMPFRGWFVLGTGEDMELSGAVPDYIIWDEPGEMPSGKDTQLDKAIEVLLEDVKAWKARPMPQLRKATERK